MAILVTGGKGFIGSQVIPKLLALGEEVVCLEPKVTPGRLGHHAGQIAMHAGSVANMDDVLAVFDQHHITKGGGACLFCLSR